MAIYRPRRSPWPLAAGLAVVALLVGFLAGYVIFGTRPPDLDAAAAAVQAEAHRGARAARGGRDRVSGGSTRRRDRERA